MHFCANPSLGHSHNHVLMQVRAQLQGWPEKVHGYLYPFITIAAGIVLGIVLYGWSVWRVI